MITTYGYLIKFNSLLKDFEVKKRRNIFLPKGKINFIQMFNMTAVVNRTFSSLGMSTFFQSTG